jgi:hypothetical protein
MNTTKSRLQTASFRNTIDLRFAWIALLATGAACGGSAGDEGTGSTSEALCRIEGICSPRVPIGPAALPPATYVTLTSDEINSAAVLLLDGATLSIDTTKTAPPVLGPPISSTNPAWVTCQQETADCAVVDVGGRSEPAPPALRALCLKEVNAQCANVPQSITQPQVFYSYLTFSDFAKQNGAADVLFPLETLHHDGIFSFYIDINYVHASFGFNVTAGFLAGATPNGPPSAWIALSNILSNSPTIILTGDSTFSPPYPDIDLTAMSASVTLGNVVPTPDGQSVDYGSVSSSFDFQWDVSDIPDWFADLFVDVQGKVESHVTQRINAAFDAPSSHAALSKALGALIARDIRAAHPAGFSAITNVVGAGTSWNVYYDAN